MNTEFIDSFRKPRLHNNFIMDLHPFVIPIRIRKHRTSSRKSFDIWVLWLKVRLFSLRIGIKLNLLLLMAATAGIFSVYTLRAGAILLYFVLAALSGNLSKFCRIFIPVSLLLAFFIILARAAFQPGETLLWSWTVINVTLEGTLFGISFALLVIEICGAIMLFYIITPIKDITYAVEMLGVSHSASYIMLASVQEIINLKNNMNIIMQSQSARGIETQGKLSVRIKAFFPILGPLLLSAISNTEEKNIAMDTRAFSAACKPTHIYELRKASLPQRTICIILNLSFAATLIWRFFI